MLTRIVLAMLAGGCGALVGGTQAFIMVGFVGIISYVLAVLGADVTFYNDMLLNHFFLPAIMFNGAGFATAYAGTKHDIRGFQTARPLGFTKDPMVLVMGMLGGLMGYGIFYLANLVGLPADTGACSVIIIGVLGRLLFNKEQNINKENLAHFKKNGYSDQLLYQILLAVLIAGGMSYFAKETGLYTIGFSISAISLIFSLIDGNFPCTHQTTLVAGYAIQQTGSIALGVLFGVIASLINFYFGEIFNTECGTHIDPPAVAIFTCSLILFTLF